MRKFLYYFPGGFKGKKYISWEREYKWNAHLAWEQQLNKEDFSHLLLKGDYTEIARRAITLESKTNLLFSFEKMALRDAVKTGGSAKMFATGLFLKPTVTKMAAKKYYYDFQYQSRPNWNTYESLLSFASLIRNDTKQLEPRDMIDLQSFVWVLGSEEYPD